MPAGFFFLEPLETAVAGSTRFTFRRKDLLPPLLSSSGGVTGVLGKINE